MSLCCVANPLLSPVPIAGSASAPLPGDIPVSRSGLFGALRSSRLRIVRSHMCRACPRSPQARPRLLLSSKDVQKHASQCAIALPIDRHSRPRHAWPNTITGASPPAVVIISSRLLSSRLIYPLCSLRSTRLGLCSLLAPRRPYHDLLTVSVACCNIAVSISLLSRPFKGSRCCLRLHLREPLTDHEI